MSAHPRYLAPVEAPPPNVPKRRYRWPWVVLAAFVLWVVLAILWMSLAVRKVKEERDFSAPPASGPAH